MAGKALLDQFSALDDPRQAWKVVYPLPEILLTVLCGTMAGAEDFVEIERWAKRKLGFLRRFLRFERGIPSHDTLNDVLNALPAEVFSGCFVAWVEGLRDGDPEIVAIDGKAPVAGQLFRNPAQAQTLAELAEQNTRLVDAVERLRKRTRLLMGAALVLAVVLGALYFSAA